MSKARSVTSPLYAVPAPPAADDGYFTDPVCAVAGHFPELPPTPAPHGAGAEVPMRRIERGSFTPKSWAQATTLYGQRTGRRG